MSESDSPILRLVGSYEFFGKSIPGAVAMLGLISLIPESQFPSAFSGELLNVAALLIILLITGLMVGEGVHTLAENIEKLFHWLARRVKNTVNFVRAESDLERDIVPVRFFDEFADKPLWVRTIKQAWDDSKEWLRRRYWGIYDSLVAHRTLLGKGIEWNFSPIPDTGRWEKGNRGHMYKMFVERYLDEYDVDLRKLDHKEIKIQYPLLTGRLEANGYDGFRHFQAIYSFCRSMWVLFVLYSIIFADLIYWQLIFGSILITQQPIALAILSGDMRSGLPLLLIGGAIIFADAAGTYKRHFIEYLISEFLAATES